MAYLIYAGMTPYFITGFLFAKGLYSVPLLGSLEKALSIYNLIIISFLAGSHWGKHLKLQNKWSFYLALTSIGIVLFIGFSYLLIPFTGFLVAFIISLGLLLLIDKKLLQEQIISQNYFKTRFISQPFNGPINSYHWIIFRMKIAIIGSSGAIGSALVKQLAETYPLADIYAFSRKAQEFTAPLVKSYIINYQEEESLRHSAQLLGEKNTLDLVVVATGLLHDTHIQPEKSFEELSVQKFQQLFLVNTITPALIAKHFIPKLDQTKRSVFAVLSARVGSISDNRLGGWYAYRASKTALNMIVKNLAIEVRRKSPLSLIVGLHPGTVDSSLSRPFQKNISKEKLFTAKESAQKLIKVLKKLQTKDSGKCFAWDGQEISP